MLWFLLFSLPFTILFYFLGYFFTGKNLKPIQETISSLEDFGSNINHEIKTPLTEIVSTLGLAKRTKTQYDEAIDQSLKSAGKITKILDSMQ
jgi:signal transduction histidine kinase